MIEGEEAGVEDSTGEHDQAGMDDYQTEEVKPITQNKTGESRTTIGVCHLLPMLRLSHHETRSYADFGVI